MLPARLLLLALALPALADDSKSTTNNIAASAKAPVSAKAAKQAVNPQPALDQNWRVSAGFIWRNIGDLSFHTHSAARGYAIPSAGFGDAGSASSMGGHFYDDGFVDNDANTSTTGETWYWGYQNGGQLNGTDLAFHGTAFSDARSLASNPGWSSDLAGGGPIIAVNWEQAAFIPGLRVGAEFSISLVTADADQHLRTLQEAQQAFNIVDHYTVDPLGFPGAPFVGDFTGPGPLIPASPDSREVLGLASGAGGTTYFDDVHESLDLKLTTLSFGPTVSFNRGRWSGMLGGGFALNVASWSADKTDTLYATPQGGKTTTLKQWHSESSGTDVLPGGYLQVTARYEVNTHWSVFGSGRYDWARDLKGDVGGSSFRVNTAGWSITAGVSFKF